MPYGEADVGVGPIAVGASAQGNLSSVSGSITPAPKIGVGEGIYAGAGAAFGYTIAGPQNAC